MKSVDYTCPLCGSKENNSFSKVQDVEYFSSNEFFHYLECSGCYCVFLKDPPIHKLSTIYPDNYYSIDAAEGSKGFLQNQLLNIKKYFDKKLFSRYLKGLSSQALACLDIGGGSGWMMSLVREADARITRTVVLDINEMSRCIAESGGHEFICSTIEAANLNIQFDFILLLNLIEHVKDPAFVLTKLSRSLNAGGVLLIKTPNTQSLNRKIFQHRYWGGCHAPRHWVLFNKANFTNLAENCGFSVLSFAYTQGAYQWAASIIGSFRQKYPSLSSRQPIYRAKVYSLLMLIFAVFDYLFLPLFKTDQMIFVLHKELNE